MSNTRSALIPDCLEFTLSIPKEYALVIYEHINKYWDLYSTHPRNTVGTKQRYKHAYTCTVSNKLEVEVYTVPIGKGQSSVKIKFNPRHLTDININKMRIFLKRILGHHALRIYHEATITRYDLAYDFKDLEITDFIFFVKHLGKCTPIGNKNGELTSLTYGSYGGRYYVRIYNKSEQMYDKTGDDKYLQQVRTRIEIQVRHRIPFSELWSIGNDFKRIKAINFDINDKDIVRNLICSHAKNRDLRKSFIKQLSADHLHTVMRTASFKTKIGMIERSFMPYRAHLFSGKKKWERERDIAFSLLKKLKPGAKAISKYELTCEYKTGNIFTTKAA